LNRPHSRGMGCRIHRSSRGRCEGARFGRGNASPMGRRTISSGNSHGRVPTNLAVFQYLRQHPGAPATQWPGNIEWGGPIFPCSNDTWKAAQQSGVLEHMPPAEVRHYAAINRRCEELAGFVYARRAAIQRAYMYAIAQPDPSLISPAQIDEEDLSHDIIAPCLHSECHRAKQCRPRVARVLISSDACRNPEDPHIFQIVSTVYGVVRLCIGAIFATYLQIISLLPLDLVVPET
jgi:hypothetical protein